MVFKDYYRVLGIEPDASIKNIKDAYRKKASESHPDKHPEGEVNVRLFQDINEAYEILVRPDSRREYDRKYYDHHQEKLNESGTHGFGIHDFDDNSYDPVRWIENLLFGFMGSPYEQGPRKDFRERPDNIHYDDLLKGPDDW
jgi:DnaJ-class molecular chaperone